ncbi:cobalamin biosynthesis protein CbiM [ANME-1 cluster archaeon ex4572_4]|nr:MAG: cobalamin biosynthesis protein CbiM [ANME-1 cluster archaeon ex4572_4]
MVHISDGVLSLPVLAAGWAVTGVLLAVALWWSKRQGEGWEAEEIPRLSVMTAAFFVASLVHVPVGPTSAHFLLNGLLGVTLGILAYPAIFIGVLLQAVLFQHGGITTIGINTANMGVAALLASAVFKGGCRLARGRREGREGRERSEGSEGSKGSEGSEGVAGIFGALAGGLAVFLAVVFTAVSLILSGGEEGTFTAVALALAVAHVPIILVETVVVGSVVVFLLKVKPELVGGLGEGKR